MKCEKIFVNELSYNALISKIYKQLIQLNINKQKALLKKKKRERERGRKDWAEDLNRHFSKEHIQMAAHEKLSKLLITRSILIKTTISYHLTLVRMAIIKTSTNNKCGRGCREN